VRVVTKTRENAILIPQRAVTEMQGSYQVAVVTPENKVDIRPVKVGQRSGSLWIINQGLKSGERVVVEGLQKVKAGMTVDPKPFQELQPEQKIG
jgi:membrane fusion protein, multidrug efflux system